VTYGTKLRSRGFAALVNVTPDWKETHKDNLAIPFDSVGFADKSWLDFYGDPHSDQLHLIERYKRSDHGTLTMQLVIEDPKAYTKTWLGDTKIHNLLSGKEAVMEELLWIPEEENAFTNRIRIPAAAQPPKK